MQNFLSPGIFLDGGRPSESSSNFWVSDFSIWNKKQDEFYEFTGECWQEGHTLGLSANGINTDLIDRLKNHYNYCLL